eukprot:JP440431.1.p4 GENE.JP440431.1~~JP440431.1.p4  ORF type:complete len:57 (+),score=6.07 JP440431.1:145-315(+)
MLKKSGVKVDAEKRDTKTTILTIIAVETHTNTHQRNNEKHDNPRQSIVETTLRSKQ